MNWSEFTKDNIKQFKKNKYNLPNNSNLVKLIKTERDNINKFIKINSKLLIKTELIKKNKIDEFDKQLCNFANTEWVDTKFVINEIKNLDKNYLYQWESITVSNEKPSLNCVYVKSNKVIKHKIKLIAYIIEYLKHENQHVNNPVNMYLVLTKLNKIFPENNQNMGVKNANTGYTDFNKNIIYIWREEEFEKVIFHEIAHYLDMDKRTHHVEPIANITGPHSYYEAITDFWGILYNLIFNSILSKTSLKLLLEVELGFIKNQAMYLNYYLKLGNWKEKLKDTITQLTPAFSYYILKFLIFEYLINNDLSYHYNDLISNITKIGFKQEPFIKLKSSRMSLLQLN